MKKVNDLRVTVTYTVGYGDIDMPDEIYEALMAKSTFDSNDRNTDDFNADVMDWLNSNTREGDALDWKYEIDDII